jgi:opacity protein-like surface antigen
VRATILIAALAVVCALAAAPAAAQDRGFGVTAGVSIGTQNESGESSPPSFTSRIGVVAGAFYTLPITPWLGVHAEGLYSQKGAKSDFRGIKSTLAVDYFEVPVLGRVRLRGGRHRLFAEGGIAAAFRLRARTRVDFSGATEEVDISDQVERFDYGAVGGGGMELGALVFGARYTFGLKDADADTSDAIKIKNRAITLTVGYRF